MKTSSYDKIAEQLMEMRGFGLNVTLHFDEVQGLLREFRERHFALEAVLLFHGGQWDKDIHARWRNITKTNDATTKALCDHIRKVLGQTTTNDELEKP